MSRLFISIFEWFERHQRTFYAVLVAVVLLCIGAASQISFKENIAAFFDNSNDEQNTIFENLNAIDKVVVMISGNDPDSVIESAEKFIEDLQPLKNEQLIDSIVSEIDEATIEKSLNFVYNYLPIFLNENDYEKIENKLTDNELENIVKNTRSLLFSTSGMAIGDVLLRDPLNIGTPLLQKFEQFKPKNEFEIYNNRLFTSDLQTMLIFLEPACNMGETGDNEALVTQLELAQKNAETETVTIEFIGAPVVAVYNARQIKKDIATTLILAILVIVAVIFFSFRNRGSIPLILLPPIFGSIFALAAIWLIQGGISSIALGAGAIVLGISLSYSIHIVAHLNHTSSVKQLLDDLAMPLTVGSFTTIGAFTALIFTSSALLHDMGLFAVFALVGTTLFCLIFLPHFLKKFNNPQPSRLLDKIEHFNGRAFEKSRLTLLLIALCTAVALFYCGDVEFNENMNQLNFMPENIAKAEEHSLQLLGQNEQVYLVTVNADFEKVTSDYTELKSVLDTLLAKGEIEQFAMLNDFIISPEEQSKRIERWNEFWAENGEKTLQKINKIAVKNGFRENAFEPFADLLHTHFLPCLYSTSEIGNVPIFSEWVDQRGKKTRLLSTICVKEKNKAAVYEQITNSTQTTIVDRAYFTFKMVKETGDNFNWILYISSIIVFLALLVSYGRLELALLAFLPMCISWVIILGAMAIFGIKFNIVNIILATFIFGIGDDFSIFVMDGLIHEYRTGKKILNAHKTAIFFSAFTVLVGTGVLLFAQHPALKSIALISILGLGVVVLVAYTVQPFLFRLMVTKRTNRGYFPNTIVSFGLTYIHFIYFVTGCLLCNLFILLAIPLPISKRAKKKACHWVVFAFNRFFLKTLVNIRTIRRKPENENYQKPAVIIANHQSFLDILLMLSTSPKIVMVAKDYVFKNPFFGLVAHYCDFYSANDYTQLTENLRERVAEGYSIVIFPEGTRSADCQVQRFHKGAFYLAQQLQLDILPIVIYGTGQVWAKKQFSHIKNGWLVAKTMPRLPFGDQKMGKTYQEQARNYRRWFVEQIAIANEEFGRTENPYFRYSIHQNYLYKTTILEWKIKKNTCRKNYK